MNAFFYEAKDPEPLAKLAAQVQAEAILAYLQHLSCPEAEKARLLDALIHLLKSDSNPAR